MDAQGNLSFSAVSLDGVPANTIIQPESNMQIEILQGHITNILPLEKPQGAVDCQLGDNKLRLNRDLSDKVVDGDNVVVAGYLQDENMTVLALNNKSNDKMFQIDGSNPIFAMGVSGFIGFYCCIQAINMYVAGEVAFAYSVGFIGLVGFWGVFIGLIRLIDISRASRRVKFSP
jgi:hypothetical protein